MHTVDRVIVADETGVGLAPTSYLSFRNQVRNYLRPERGPCLPCGYGLDRNGPRACFECGFRMQRTTIVGSHAVPRAKNTLRRQEA